MSPNVTTDVIETSTALTDQIRLVLDFKGTYLVAQHAFSWATIGTGFIGTIGNVLTILVYARLNYPSTIDISYTALALSDLCCVLASAMCGITTMKEFTQHFDQETREYVTILSAGFPYLAFSRTTALITAWISMERCLSVLFPFRVRVLITRKVTKVILGTIFTVGFLPILFVYASYSSESTLGSETNSTTLAPLQDTAEGICRAREIALFLFGMVYPALAWLTVTVCTALLCTKIRQSGRWRRQNAPRVRSAIAGIDSGTANQPRSTSTRENRITKIAIMVMSLFLLCSVPLSAHLIARLSIPGYFNEGSLRYLYLTNGMVCVYVSQLNSSLNIIIFTVSGHKFRSALRQMFSCFGKRRH